MVELEHGYIFTPAHDLIAGDKNASMSELLLEDVNLNIQPAQHTVLIGANGSGKSVLARTIQGSYELKAGKRIAQTDAIAYVSQDAPSQFVAQTIEENLAFPLLMSGMSKAQADAQIQERLQALPFTFDVPLTAFVNTLSGGQQVLVALAAALMSSPLLIILDEVCAQLDTALRSEIAHLVDTLVEQGTAVLEITHDIERICGADSVLIIAQQHLLSATAEEFFNRRELQIEAGFAGTPLLKQFVNLVETGAVNPSLSLAKQWIETDALTYPQLQSTYRDRIAMTLDRMSYSPSPAFTMGPITARIHTGITLLIGSIGAGKSTLAKLLAGTVKPSSGQILLGDKNNFVSSVGLSIQRPQDQIFESELFDEIAFAPRAQELEDHLVTKRVRSALQEVNLQKLAPEQEPHLLSGGQMRRVALAGILAQDAEAYVFDEPTAGLDSASCMRLVNTAQRLAQDAAVIVISHDLDFWLPYAHHIIALKHGSIVRELHAPMSPQDIVRACEEASTAAPLLVSIAAQTQQRRRHARTHTHIRTRSFDPYITIAGTLAIVVATIATANLAQLAVLALICASSIAVLRPPARSLTQSLRALTIVAIFSLIAATLRLDGTATLTLIGPAGLSAPGALRALFMLSKLACATLTIVALSHAASALELAQAFVHLLSPFIRRREARGGLILTLSMAMQSIPQLFDQMRQVHAVALARGAYLHAHTVRQKLSVAARELVPTFVSLARHTQTMAQALLDRLYTPERAQYLAYSPQVSTRTILACILFAVSVLAILVLA